VANDPASETGLNAGSITLVKADLGIKRVCPSCGARFYDLQKRPIECPKCQFSFEPEALYKQRRPRTPDASAPAVIERDEEEEEAEENEEIEAEEEEAEAPVVEATSDEDEEEETPDTETEAEGAGMSVVDADEADIEDIEDEDLGEDEEEDDSLLEEEDDEDDDVSGIIDADIEKDER
jgi:uncharacterized protein (TIGR02300 family)